ncbi:MAG: hypothetical protein AAF532_12020 [Planctomycetota bacterium]
MPDTSRTAAILALARKQDHGAGEETSRPVSPAVSVPAPASAEPAETKKTRVEPSTPTPVDRVEPPAVSEMLAEVRVGSEAAGSDTPPSIARMLAAVRESAGVAEMTPEEIGPDSGPTRPPAVADMLNKVRVRREAPAAVSASGPGEPVAAVEEPAVERSLQDALSAWRKAAPREGVRRRFRYAGRETR